VNEKKLAIQIKYSQTMKDMPLVLMLHCNLAARGYTWYTVSFYSKQISCHVTFFPYTYTTFFDLNKPNFR